jgi:hypothetical protein
MREHNEAQCFQIKSIGIARGLAEQPCPAALSGFACMSPLAVFCHGSLSMHDAESQIQALVGDRGPGMRCGRLQHAALMGTDAPVRQSVWDRLQTLGLPNNLCCEVAVATYDGFIAYGEVRLLQAPATPRPAAWPASPCAHE